jgi:predicted alpha/beta superfamily hydrolase
MRGEVIKRIGHMLLLLILSSGALHPQNADRTQVGAGDAVQIPGTKLLHLTSALVGQEYDIYVQLPGNYSDTSKVFPVVYVLDGQWDFSLVTALYGQQYYDGFIPALIIVGITWGGANPDYDALRARDLTPTKAGPPQSGGGPKFLAFIKNELVPFIESKYRTAKDDRTLVGSSYGGLFTLYALFHETTLFQRYVLTSPALDFDNGVTSAYEKDYAAINHRLPVKLFMAVGGLEGTKEFLGFVDRLKTRKYEDLQLESRILEGMGHSGGKAEGYTRGLQAVFARPSLKLDPAVLDRYVGMYQQSSGATLMVSVDDGRLVVQAQKSSSVAFYAETETDFYVRGRRLLLHFKKDNTGKITGFLAERYGGEEFVRKVN